MPKRMPSNPTGRTTVDTDPQRRGLRAVVLRPPRLAALALGVAALVQAGLGISLTTASSSSPALTLSSDADGIPLVSASRMAPGDRITRCLRLDYGNAVDGDRIGLVSSSTGALADHLDVRVEAGTGGDAASCTGFTGAVVWTGTLAGLTGEHGSAATALSLKKLSAGSSSMTVRLLFTLQDVDAAQGTVATSDLLWVADAVGNRPVPPPVVTPVDPTPPPVPPVPSRPVPVPVPTVPTVPVPVPVPTVPVPTVPVPTRPTTTAVPVPPASPGAPTSTTAPQVPSAPAATSPAPSAEPTEQSSGGLPGAAASSTPSPAAPGGSSGSPGAGGGSGPLASVGKVLGSGARAVTTGVKAVASAAGALAHAVTAQVIAPVAAAAAPAAKGAGFGLGGTAPLLGAFLLIQDRIDRRDPKLALAPTYADPDLTFDDTPRGPMTPPTSPPGEPSTGSGG